MWLESDSLVADWDDIENSESISDTRIQVDGSYRHQRIRTTSFSVCWPFFTRQWRNCVHPRILVLCVDRDDAEGNLLADEENIETSDILEDKKCRLEHF